MLKQVLETLSSKFTLIKHKSLGDFAHALHSDLQAHAADSKPHASGRGAERKHRRIKDNKGGHRDRRQARIGL